MEPTVVSFYTQNTPYEKEVEALIASCRKVGLPFSIDPLPHLGSWEKNCAFKPDYLLGKLQVLQAPILWLDADAIVWKKPSFNGLEGKDLALYSDPSLPDNHPSKVQSGTLLFYPTEKSFSILKAWSAEMERLLNIDSNTWDQIGLRNVLSRLDVKVHVWDSRYCRIFTKITSKQELNASFFIHFQASRTLKKILNREVVPFWKEDIHIDQKKNQFFTQNWN